MIFLNANKIQERFKLHFLMLICAALVSGSFTVGEAIAHDLDPTIITLIRFLLSALILLPYIFFRHSLLIPLKDLGRYSLISSCLVLFFWAMFLALRYTTALNTSVLFTLVPSLSSLYAIILVRERLGSHRLIALVLGVIGPLWIIFEGNLQLIFTLDWNKGDLIFLAGCLSMGLYPPLVRLLHRGEDMLQMTFWILVTGSCWLLIPVWTKIPAVVWTDISLKTWLGIFYLSLFSTLISFFLTQFITLRLGPTRVMAYSYLYPAFVVFINLFLGKGWPDLIVIPGFILIFFTMLVVQWEKKTVLS